MSFERIRIDGHSIYIPSAVSEDKNIEEAVQALVFAGSYAYNRALTCLEDGRVESAFRAASSAIRTAPYCAQFVEFGCVLSIRHGDFQFARSLLQWAHATGMDEAWPDYEASLQSAVDRWNRFISDLGALREHYQSPKSNASYRELLLLASRLDNNAGAQITDVERQHFDTFSIQVDARTRVASSPSSSGANGLDQDKRSSPRHTERPAWSTIGLSGVIGILLGTMSLWAIDLPTPPQPDQTVEPSTGGPSEGSSEADPAPVYSSLASVQLHLAQGDPLRAYQMLGDMSLSAERDTLRTVQKQLEEAAEREMYDNGVAAWRGGSTSRAVSLLKPIAETDVGRPQERLYALGMSAAEIGQEDVAIRALESLQDHLTPAYSHYAAQSAYTLVRLLPEEKAQQYARLIEERFSNTIYNNSVVQARQ